MRPAVILSSDPRLSQRGVERPAHRVLCSPEVDDIARESPEAVITEPWALIDCAKTRIDGVAIDFEEIAGATLRRARRWLESQEGAAARQAHLIIPTSWGNVRIARAVSTASYVGIEATPVRAALLLSDALSSSFAKWNYTVELSNKGAAVTLIHRQQRTLTIISTRVVLRVDPDDDVIDGFAARVVDCIVGLRDGHRPAQDGSHEVLVCGQGARMIVSECDARRLLSFPVPAQAIAETAVTLPFPRKTSRRQKGDSM
ncbi:MAG TPA: hypothetical protein K8V11_05445 [Dietzia timorensis]|uniref:Uncharacterized protein n=1 Tax=Dietzia timorensis TaxID=499555 RepID=A0A921F5E2_9ACTN|nr:hypothetical protein [Dietzia timorensis]HJE90434.1 hypothetical protein [Dietzia timorensis]